MIEPAKDQTRERRRFVRLFLWCLLGVFGVSLAATHIDRDSIVPTIVVPRSVSGDHASVRVFDTSPLNGEVLYSRTSTGDLWLRDALGGEHWLASNAVRANFSPDGKKFAYATVADDLFIQTIQRRQIAQLTRARDYTWSSNSMAVTFSAIASVEYPELEQIVVYDLDSNAMHYIPAER